jgi:hypothetical protein
MGLTNDAVLGWRVWRVDDDRLQSWAVHHYWEPGTNTATCRGGAILCSTSPGRRCQCGFWALWSPLQCLSMASSPIEPPWYAIGLIAAWGEVALHGREGFRAERASVRCLFTDWAGAVPVPRPATGHIGRWVERLRDSGHRRFPLLAHHPDPGRLGTLRRVASRYSVPLVPMRTALDSGLLSEWAVPNEQLREVAAWVAALARRKAGCA